MFGLDYRSLALLRMGLAVALLMTLRECGADLRAFYTDAGVLPRALLLANDYAPPWPNLHMQGGGLAFQASLFGLQVILALFLLMGYRTRLATALSFYLLFSMQGRNPLVIFGPDMMLRLMLFWGIFLPLGRRFSLDAALGRVPPPAEPVYLNIAGVAYTVQFMLIYILNGVTKTGASWTVDHTAVARALDLDVYRLPLGSWINQHDWLTARLTVLTRLVETYGTLLFIVPVFSGWLRLLGFMLLTGLQLGFNFSMDLGLFGVVMMAIMLGLLPVQFWTWFAEPLGRHVAGWLRRGQLSGGPPQLWLTWQSRSGAAAQRWQARWMRWPRLTWVLCWARHTLVLFFLWYIVAMNVDFLRRFPPLLPPELRGLAWNCGLDQHFDMFAPDPMADDGWFVISGTQANDHEVNVFSGEHFITLARPPSLAATFQGERWGGYLTLARDPSLTWLLEPLALYLGREWNRTHAPAEQVHDVRIIFMLQWVGPQHLKSPVQTVQLWTETIGP